MVVKHPRGEHAHGLAAVRGGFRLGFVHELPVFFFCQQRRMSAVEFSCFVLFLPNFACFCCLSCLVGAGVHGGVPGDRPEVEEELGRGRRREHHSDQPEKRL